jgi:hypothetical protein
MSKKPEFDVAAAHKYFAANCFNSTWELLDKEDRSPDDDEQMIRQTMASAYHWTQREDCTDTNLSVAFWQASRVYAVVGQAGNARRYGQMCLDISRNLEPFYLGYAYEALARAESVAGNSDESAGYLVKARKAAENVKDEDSKGWLIADLDGLA